MIRCNQCEKISNCPYGIQDGESIVSTCDDFYFNLSEHDKQVRNGAIDEALKKVRFEENWLFNTYKENGSKYKNADVDIAFCGIKHFLEQLKEQRNEQKNE